MLNSKPANIMPALAVLALTACGTTAVVPDEKFASARLDSATGAPVGTARLLIGGESVALEVSVSGLEAGPKGFHLHTTGRCTAPDFRSAGGHLNPLGVVHGILSADGGHLGDLPNLEVGTNGAATTTVDIVGSRDEVLEHLFDEDGTAIVIHAGPDDYSTDPAGAAGPRVACGVLSAS